MCIAPAADLVEGENERQSLVVLSDPLFRRQRQVCLKHFNIDACRMGRFHSAISFSRFAGSGIIHAASDMIHPGHAST